MPHTQDELRYWLALLFAKDIGPATAKRLLAAFGSPEAIFRASLRSLTRVDGVGETRARQIADFQAWDRIERELSAIAAIQADIILYPDPDYPESLRPYDDAPLVLYKKGSLADTDRYAVAIVGSRLMSEYGRKAADLMARGLAEKGITVVSGLARGIDTAAHRGALAAGGRTIAVLGCGIDRPYPPENRALFSEIAANGCLISEFPVGTPPVRENFPRRNRIISGLALGVLIVEAAQGSGSLITADYALDQNKDVFAIPGPISSANAKGTNQLIQKGAKLVGRVEDILEELAPKLRGMLRESGSSPAAPGLKLEITQEEHAICTVLGDDPKHVDLIARETGVPPSRLSAILLSLEIKGVIRQHDGKRFTLV
jgi:DNA processing protein